MINQQQGMRKLSLKILTKKSFIFVLNAKKHIFKRTVSTNRFHRFLRKESVFFLFD